MGKEELPKKPTERKERPKRSEKAKARGRRKHFKFCQVHSPNTNPHRYRDMYPRWWESTLKYERG